jgi:YEATS domain-containing protein 4
VPGGPDLASWLKKVVFVLHETFPNPVRNVENPPFELEETGYGGFYIAVKLHFQPYSGEKQQQRQHFLQLEPYGDEALLAEQARTGIVRSEVVEFIEFNEPTETFWDALTSEEQWNYMIQPVARGGKGRGKNAAAVGLPPPQDRSVELPDKAVAGSVYSRETEEALLQTLLKAATKCEEETAEVLKKSKEVNDQLAEAKKGISVDAKLLALHERVPPPKRK